MFKMIFKGGGQYAELIIDRLAKKLWVKSSKTSYRLIETSWSKLFDRGKEESQEKITDSLDEKDFKQVIISSIMQAGYNHQKTIDNFIFSEKETTEDGTIKSSASGQ